MALAEAESKIEELKSNFHLKQNNSSKLNTITADMGTITDFIDSGRKNISILASELENLQESDQVAELDAEYTKLLDLETRVNSQRLIFSALKQRIDQGEKMKDIMAPYKRLLDETSQKTTEDPSRHLKNKKYKAFREELWSVNHPDEMMPSLLEDDDNDIVMGPTKISLKCPITTTWFVKPMKSKTCSHIYSQDAIFSLLRSSNVCPVSGCNKTLRRDLLELDPEMEARVVRAQAREKNTQSTADFFDI